ncbi:MAG: hypothetical protein K8R74_11750, partial [Bacteroidales bacterium]|nr:hypothetical protein [Bacteroidales bacterium]
ISLNTCMKNLEDAEIKKTYYALLSSSIPSGSSKEEFTSTEKDHIAGEDNKSISFTSKARITLQFGYTHRTKRVPDGVNVNTKNYYKKLKNSFHVGTDINYFWNENNSIGVSASFSPAKSTLPDLVDIDSLGNIIAQGDLNQNVNLFYVGPSYFSRSIGSNTKTHVLFGLTMGYYGYNERLNWIGETVNLTGGTIGFGFSLGVDFLSSEHFAAGLQASLLMGWLKKIKVDGNLIELAERENLTRIDLTIGFRFLP